ncbi:MAG: Hsp70 family protein [Candidatus Bathyarchaeia archaeon]|jgi:molecular chaperone DnaK
MSQTIGIDLGTTNSAAAVLKDGKIRLVPASEGPTLYGKMFPSIVAFREDGEIVVGKNAKNYFYTHPERTVRWIKRKIGTHYIVDIDGRGYTPQEISALIIRKIKKDAEAFLGKKIDKAVISAPAYFSNNQRNATKEAGEMAGLEVLRIVSEPTAASLAYGLGAVKKNLKIAVLDLGAGTFDITILHMNTRVFKVMSTSGDTQIGGKDMDDLILDHLVDKIKEKYGVDLKNDIKNLNRLRDTGEGAKIRLSDRYLTTINTQLDVDGSKLRSRIVLTRENIEKLIRPQLKKLRQPIEQALRDAGLNSRDVDRLILVGGPTRTPIIREYFKSFFQVEPETGIDPMGIVAVGACALASTLNGEIRNMLLLDVTPLSLGVETSGGVFTRLIKRNTTIPTETSMTFATYEDYQTAMMINVLQGEREMANDNISLGLFRLDGIPLAPRYEQKVEVTFKIDLDGILTVSAEILDTEEKKAIKVTKTTLLSEIDIERMIIEATKFNEMDERKKEIIETRKRAEAAIYATQKLIEEKAGRDPEIEEEALRETLEKLNAVLTLNGCALNKVKEFTRELLEHIGNVNTKRKKVSQAKILIYSAEKGLERELSKEKRKKMAAALQELEAAPCSDVDKKMNKLKETIMLY